jgi:hypothetical protein
MIRALVGPFRWFAFPAMSCVLAIFCYNTTNPQQHDPRQWGPLDWVLLLGPLIGFSFVAGATSILPDDPTVRGVRSIWSRRALWMGVGPWFVFLLWVAGYYAFQLVSSVLPLERWTFGKEGMPSYGNVLGIAAWCFVGTSCYGWLIVAVAVIRRGRRLQRLGKALWRGLATAAVFVGSLIGTFWAATAAFRSYFFDPTVVQSILVATICLALISGCGPVTAGELRRRELFESLLIAWVIGLALVWRWWSRRR